MQLNSQYKEWKVTAGSVPLCIPVCHKRTSNKNVLRAVLNAVLSVRHILYCWSDLHTCSCQIRAIVLILLPVQVLVLHSLVPREEQDLAVQPAKSGHCKVHHLYQGAMSPLTIQYYYAHIILTLNPMKHIYANHIVWRDTLNILAGKQGWGKQELVWVLIRA
jgi:hypothetical protein